MRKVLTIIRDACVTTKLNKYKFLSNNTSYLSQEILSVQPKVLQHITDAVHHVKITRHTT